MYLWTAFTIGLFGSLHCAGMCGPIAMTVSAGGNRLAHLLPYNLGRMLTYTLLGGVIGLLGKGIFLAGFQKTMSVAMGVTLLAIAVFSINVETGLLKISALNRLIFNLKSHLGRLLKNHAFPAAFGVGLLNGLLPCGLVYVAVFGALHTGEALRGMAYMALFGLGTVPMMVLTGWAGNLASLRARRFLKKTYPAFLVGLGLLFVFRGLNFHLPADFFFWEKMASVPMCH